LSSTKVLKNKNQHRIGIISLSDILLIFRY
jgi:hypothetical protein